MFYDNSYAAQYKLNAHINGKLDILHSKCTNNNHRVCVRASHPTRSHAIPYHPSSQDDCFVDLAVTSNTLAFKGPNWDPLMPALCLICRRANGNRFVFALSSDKFSLSPATNRLLKKKERRKRTEDSKQEIRHKTSVNKHFRRERGIGSPD